jgi:hypothetical protein
MLICFNKRYIVTVTDKSRETHEFCTNGVSIYIVIFKNKKKKTTGRDAKILGLYLAKQMQQKPVLVGRFHPFYRPRRPLGSVERYSSTLFLDLGTRMGWVVSVTPRPLSTPGKDTVPIVQEAGWAPGPVWTGAENLAATGILSPDRPVRSQSLYRLSYRSPQKPVLVGSFYRNGPLNHIKINKY